MSGIASFCSVFMLILINAIMKIYIDLNYYFAIFWVLAIGLSMGLILIDSRKIFTKKKLHKVSRKKKVVKKKPSRTNETKRKIS